MAGSAKSPRFVVGIDLGTTHCAVSALPLQGERGEQVENGARSITPESPRLSRRLQELGESESWDAKVGFHRRFANAQFAS